MVTPNDPEIPVEIVEMDTPWGRIELAVRGEALCMLVFSDSTPAESLRRQVARRFPAAPSIPARDPAGVVTRLRAYADGQLDALDAIPVDAEGTPFQKRVWRELRLIPAGATRSYAEVARALALPAGVRAVGAANGRNPISIVVPCHRVIASDGSLRGYAGGLERKRLLLEHEGGRGAQRPLVLVPAR